MYPRVEATVIAKFNEGNGTESMGVYPVLVSAGLGVATVLLLGWQGEVGYQTRNLSSRIWRR